MPCTVPRVPAVGRSIVGEGKLTVLVGLDVTARSSLLSLIAEDVAPTADPWVWGEAPAIRCLGEPNPGLLCLAGPLAASTLVSRPVWKAAVVLLDDPAQGLDDRCRTRTLRSCRRLARPGHTVVIATGDAQDALDAAADRVVLLDGPTPVAIGPLAVVAATGHWKVLASPVIVGGTR